MSESDTQKKVLVTGASGFFGVNLVRRLCKEGYKVRTLSRAGAPPKVLRDLPLEHFVGDLTNRERVFEAVRGCDIVIHMGGLISYKAKDQQRQFTVNVIGTRYVMQACLDAKVSRVIHTSSVAAMGVPPQNTDKIADESFEYNLEGLNLNYCDSKHLAENEALNAYDRGLNVVILCPGITFGEGDHHSHHKAIIDSMEKWPFVFVPPGGVTFCDINDVVEAHISAIKNGSAGSRYAIVSANLTFKEAAEIYLKTFQKKKPIFVVPAPILIAVSLMLEFFAYIIGKEPTFNRQTSYLSAKKIFFSPKKAIAELNFKQTPFKETLKRLAPYYKNS